MSATPNVNSTPPPPKVDCRLLRAGRGGDRDAREDGVIVVDVFDEAAHPVAHLGLAAWDETCPVSTEGGMRRVQLVREGGGRGGFMPDML
jgi:hypothetical protein